MSKIKRFCKKAFLHVRFCKVFSCIRFLVEDSRYKDFMGSAEVIFAISQAFRSKKARSAENFFPQTR